MRNKAYMPTGESWDVLVDSPLVLARPWRHKNSKNTAYLENIAISLSATRDQLARAMAAAFEYFRFEHLRDENGYAILGKRQ